ncbi:MAG TPA: Rieske (2Fe-2S) protein [Actinoplanes sp.]|nr:Rieske (2Fe-2S) protein [Actinoplanes sp.]
MTDAQPQAGPSSPQDQAHPGGAPTRRSVLLGAGALGATCLVAACATDAGNTPAPVPAGSPNPPAGGGVTAGITLAAVKDVPVGSGLITDDYVITQPAEGTFKAFSKVCTHQGCDVSEVREDTVICRCHNSVFSIEDGSVKGGPAKAPLKATKVVAEGGKIVTA